ncbi:hypothetical protein PPYR_13272 [Photinus pyralis]|uniref:BAG domain-containing protein n=1 Tax=Photinus pyralis TaxID=7054 RepID=A0A1Y1MSJ7_PHOPY|nr:hypothetical protein PPYR_13272 [Photinus pyralis]
MNIQNYPIRGRDKNKLQHVQTAKNPQPVKQTERPSPITSFIYKQFKVPVSLATTSKYRAKERPQSAFAGNRPTHSSEGRKMDIKHTTMLTNLAASYYEKFHLNQGTNDRNAKSKVRPWTGKGRLNENVINAALNKLKILESATDNRNRNDSDFVCIKKSGLCSDSDDSFSTSQFDNLEFEGDYHPFRCKSLHNRRTPEKTERSTSFTVNNTIEVATLTDFEGTTKTPAKSAIPIKRGTTKTTGPQSLEQKIKHIVDEVSGLEDEIANFSGLVSDDRDYIFMEEVMMRNLIKLDNLNIDNMDSRMLRKQAIQLIQKLMNRLQQKLHDNIDLDISQSQKVKC